MLVHYITSDDTVETRRSLDAPWRFIGAQPDCRWVLMRVCRRRPLLVHPANRESTADNGLVVKDLPLNIGATNLAHQLQKYQLGFKSRRGSEGEPEYESIHDIFEWEPLGFAPWIYGNAIFIEEE